MNGPSPRSPGAIGLGETSGPGPDVELELSGLVDVLVSLVFPLEPEGTGVGAPGSGVTGVTGVTGATVGETLGDVLGGGADVPGFGVTGPGATGLGATLLLGAGVSVVIGWDPRPVSASSPDEHPNPMSKPNTATAQLGNLAESGRVAGKTTGELVGIFNMISARGHVGRLTCPFPRYPLDGHHGRRHSSRQRDVAKKQP